MFVGVGYFEVSLNVARDGSCAHKSYIITYLSLPGRTAKTSRERQDNSCSKMSMKDVDRFSVVIDASTPCLSGNAKLSLLLSAIFYHFGYFRY